jgi:hypothetical protein
MSAAQRVFGEAQRVLRFGITLCALMQAKAERDRLAAEVRAIEEARCRRERRGEAQ